MTLPSSGPISISMVAAELGISAAGLSLNDSRVRALAGKPSGTISMSDLYGKSSYIREPASGDYYIGTPGNVTQVAHFTLSNTSTWQWFNAGLASGLSGLPASIVHGGWRYHLGAYRESLSGIDYYGIWRETL